MDDTCLTLARRSRRKQLVFYATVSRALTLRLSGRLADSQRTFQQAEALHRGLGFRQPMLYGGPGAHYCLLLLDLGHHSEAHTRASQNVRLWQELLYFPLGEAGLDRLSLAEAAHRLLLAARPSARASPADAATKEARTYVDQAVACLRRANDVTELPRGLIARAAILRDLGRRADAQGDLEEVLELSARIGLRLHETDARLLQGHMGLGEDPPDIEGAQQSLARAQQLVAATGYHLRDADLLILEGRLLAERQSKDAGRAKLEEAIHVARREEKDGCVYRLAVDQANRYLGDLSAS